VELLGRLLWRSAVPALAVLLLAFALVGISIGAGAAPGSHPRGIAVVAAEALPPEARHTLELIRIGGPYPYERDGVIFGNRERLLPPRERGYYREYTVATPVLTHRGAQRIVAGRGGELYYSEDHYRSFKRIRE
jgi:ribonuclease T1